MSFLQQLCCPWTSLVYSSPCCLWTCLSYSRLCCSGTCLCVCSPAACTIPRGVWPIQQHLQTCLSIRAAVLHLDVSVYKSEHLLHLTCRDRSTGATVLCFPWTCLHITTIAFVVPVYMCFFVPHLEVSVYKSPCCTCRAIVQHLYVRFLCCCTWLYLSTTEPVLHHVNVYESFVRHLELYGQKIL